MIRVDITNNQRTLKIALAEWRTLTRQVLSAEGIDEATIGIALVDDATIHRVNRDHLKHDYPTDVVTFPYSDDDEPLSGEIVISTEFAAREAAGYGHSSEREAKLYLIHGLLHLVGFTDHEAGAARKMKRRQEELLDQYVSPKPARAPGMKSTKKVVRRKGIRGKE